MTENPDRIERTLELLLYAPLGVGLFLKETAPAFVDMFVSRGRAEIDRRHEDVQQRVTTARSLGQVALAFGPPIVRERVERTVGDARRRAEGFFGSSASSPTPTPPAPPAAPPSVATPPAAPPPVATPAPATTPTPPVAPTPAPVAPTTAYGWEASTAPPTRASDSPISNNGGADSGAALPIPGYDALSASQVVERLLGLSVRELEAVHAYETAHRQRRTILGKIEQLIG